MENIEEKNESTPSGHLENSNDTPEYETSSSVGNLCIACATTKRAVVFVPCGHYIACLPCGHGMTICSMCRSKITACVRIYE
jgi:E3 ubiquitin-protein ligase XIAP